MSNKKRKTKIFVTRQVYTYAEIVHAARSLLMMGQDKEDGSFFQFMSSLVFTAFSFEAYLNHIGEKVFGCWDSLERLSPKDKLRIIAEKLELDINFGERPYQSLIKLFKFRNSLAHGKSEIVNQEETVSLNKVYDHIFYDPQTEWENYCNQENASRAIEDVEKIILEIHDKANIDGEIPFSGGHTSKTFSG